MDAARWSQIEALFAAALDLPAQEREAFVRARGDDDGLAESVLAMLSADARSQRLLDGRPSDALPGVTSESLLEDPESGRQIGPYTIGEEIGRGGMGAVYRAERTDGAFRQTVALKLVKRGMDSEAVLQRFRAERQILARLNHPGIARVLDGGMTEDGRPWLAMECVNGLPITDYCEQHRLSIRERTALFEQVCAAVGYAHRQLVVHRDLKPSNILVTPEGAVKLLDFGIAKVLAGDEPGEPLTPLTQPGHQVLTPEYAAPEQVTGGAISTTTDVYSLGVVLYELLAGQRPYAFEARTPAVIDHVVRTVQPARPSTVVAASPPTTGLAVDKLRRQLAGDLDTICLTALRKEPERRYTSVEAFADDLARHRDGLPVLARPDTAGYRARKFVQRHRAGVAATATALLAIVALTGFYTSRLAEERDRAQTEATKAEEVSEFLSGLFRASSPGESEGEDLTASELLERGIGTVREDLADQPEVQTRLLATISRVYWQLGQYDDGIRAGRQALTIGIPALGEEHPEVAVARAALARSLSELGEFAEADSLLTLAASAAREDDAISPKLLAHILLDWAWVRQETGSAEETLQTRHEVYKLRVQHLGPMHLETIVAASEIGNGYERAQQYEEAERWRRLALERHREVLGSSHYEVAVTMNNLAQTLYVRGKFSEADRLYREVLPVFREALEPDHPYIAIGLSGHGQTLNRLGRFAEAEGMFREALDIRTRAFGPVHWSVAETLNNMAVMYEDTGDLDRAIRTFREVLAIDEQAEDNPGDKAISALNLARVLRKAGRLAEASPTLDTAASLFEVAFPAGNPVHGSIAQEQGMLRAEMGDLTGALESARLGLRLRADLDPEHPDRVGSGLQEATLLARLGECGEAERKIRVVRKQAGDNMVGGLAERLQRPLPGCTS